ncbi:hypothetical protein AB1K54_03635 [Microbacterium sp. BWT-B31]|uniref:hypothetical protein n=1 Tax=Microbacterium sp. BWT-B31 TaxID=3232072 RepID=UPI0035280D70
MSDPGHNPAAPVPPYEPSAPPAPPAYGAPPPAAAPEPPYEPSAPPAPPAYGAPPPGAAPVPPFARAGAPWGAAPTGQGGAPQHPTSPAHPGAPAYPAIPAYAPPYAQPGPHVALPAPGPSAGPSRTTPALGLVALIAGIFAAIGATVVASVAAWRIGVGAGHELTLVTRDGDFPWAALTPVRDWVLLGEVSFWVGTALGLWALVQGTIAIVTNRGRGLGIAAVVLAGIGPVLFFVGLRVFLTAGLAAGTGVGG